jgi:hypothetical protein
MEEERDKKNKSWYIRKGFLHGTTMNKRNALDEQYYSQLEHVNTAYCNTIPIQILEHLDSCWCPLNVQGHGRHRVQLVRRVAQEHLVRGSNPSGARVQWNEGG